MFSFMDSDTVVVFFFRLDLNHELLACPHTSTTDDHLFGGIQYFHAAAKLVLSQLVLKF